MGCCQSNGSAAPAAAAARPPAPARAPAPAPPPAAAPLPESEPKSPDPTRPEPVGLTPPPPRDESQKRETPSVPRLEPRDLSHPRTEEDVDAEEERLQEEFALGYAQPYSTTAFNPDDPSLGMPRDKEMEAIIFVEMLRMQFPRRQRADPESIEYAS
eukprot:TRINITY_DN10469_c0_g2_i2.p3 TRINITY_DN10469_c0_g2~~TRINITY_DN10469_c0_g2_i2.p3  ORF type:complete len:157 (+),score=44.55 TRINITY_DN10469_c0_g2_i2:283-753(+)